MFRGKIYYLVLTIYLGSHENLNSFSKFVKPKMMRCGVWVNLNGLATELTEYDRHKMINTFGSY